MPIPIQAQSPPHRDPALDGLRGFAVLLVFLFHYGGGLRAHNPLVRFFGYLTQAGWTGVDLFFALSGFLITGLLVDNLHAPHALRNFYARRALRILPLYFAALLACAVAALLHGVSPGSLRPLLIYAAFLQNLPPLASAALHTPPPLPIHHLWSLAVEEQFYVLWPFALLAVRKPRRQFQLCLWTFALSCLCRAMIFAPHLLPYATAQSFAVFLPLRAGALALGGALALHLRRDPNSPFESAGPSTSPPAHPVSSTEAKRSKEARVPRRERAAGRNLAATQTTLVLAALALLVILLTALHTHTFLLNNRAAFVFNLPAVDVLSAILVALALQPNLLRRTLSTPALGFLGRISYGFYVLHILLEPLFDCLGAVLTHTHIGFAYQTARLVTALPITIAAAWLSFTLLEGPFLRLKRRYPRTAASPLVVLP